MLPVPQCCKCAEHVGVQVVPNHRASKPQPALVTLGLLRVACWCWHCCGGVTQWTVWWWPLPVCHRNGTIAAGDPLGRPVPVSGWATPSTPLHRGWARAERAVVSVTGAETNPQRPQHPHSPTLPWLSKGAVRRVFPVCCQADTAGW